MQTATILLEGKTNNWSKIRRETQKKRLFSETWTIKEIVSILFKILTPQAQTLVVLCFVAFPAYLLSKGPFIIPQTATTPLSADFLTEHLAHLCRREVRRGVDHPSNPSNYTNPPHGSGLGIRPSVYPPSPVTAQSTVRNNRRRSCQAGESQLTSFAA